MLVHKYLDFLFYVVTFTNVSILNMFSKILNIFLSFLYSLFLI